jgi:hypothetical protein
MDTARLILSGKLVAVPDTDTEPYECFYKVHPETRDWMAHKFALYTFEELDMVRWIGGFGDRHFVGWLEVDDYLAANGDDDEDEGRLARAVQVEA